MNTIELQNRIQTLLDHSAIDKYTITISDKRYITKNDINNSSIFNLRISCRFIKIPSTITLNWLTFEAGSYVSESDHILAKYFLQFISWLSNQIVIRQQQLQKINSKRNKAYAEKLLLDLNSLQDKLAKYQLLQ